MNLMNINLFGKKFNENHLLIIGINVKSSKLRNKKYFNGFFCF